MVLIEIIISEEYVYNERVNTKEVYAVWERPIPCYVQIRTLTDHIVKKLPGIS